MTKFFIIVFLFIQSVNFSQSHVVNFGQPEGSMDGGMTIEIFSDTPSEKIILPNINSDSLKYFSLFYTYDTADDPFFSVVVDRKENMEILYIDRNNDEDLTNDGEPIQFLHIRDSVFLDFQPVSDPKQIVRHKVFRTPDLHDSIKYDYIDSLGNMAKNSVDFWKVGLTKPDFKGKKGTFYYLDRITKRYGQLKIKEKEYKVAIWDFSNNGLYNDKDDKVIIDFNKNNVLNFRDKEEMFLIGDVIKIGDKNYTLNNIDKYGDNITFTETLKGAYEYYVSVDNDVSDGTKKLNKNFWESSLQSFDSLNFSFEKIKGKVALLNIWGEWCKPCIAEIDELLKLHAKYSDKIEFISIVKPYNLEKAKRIISERGMDWQHLIITDEFEKKFMIVGYPTNILILKSGLEFIDNFHLDENVINEHIK